MAGLDEEMAKASGQIAIDTAADGRRALKFVFGDAAAEVANILSDNVKLWRFRNLLRIKDKVDEIAAERGLTPNQLRALPMSDALRVANAAAEEDQEEVQGLWARLIANAMAEATGSVDRAFVDLLKAVSPSEVIFLDLLWRLDPFRNGRVTYAATVDAFDKLDGSEEAGSWRQVSQEQRHVSLQNLQRLRCISPPLPDVEAFLTRTEYIQGEFRAERFETLDARKVERQFQAMTKYLREAVGGDPVDAYPIQGRERPEWALFELTSLGRALMHACRMNEGTSIESSR